MFELRNYQKKAIEDLDIRFKELWCRKETQYTFNLIAPTGSGKTIIMAEFCHTLKTNLSINEEFCFVWFSIGGKSEGSIYKQSLDKFKKYLGDDTTLNLMDIENITPNDEMQDQSVLFVNWDSLVAKNKEGLKLTRSNENCDESIWVDLVNKTKSKRKIILIVDESHLNSHSELANEIKEQIDPKIIINVSATPINGYNKGSDVKIDDIDVIESGIIKQSIIFQTDDEIKLINEFENLDQDEKMLKLAVNKRNEILKAYRKLNIDINPLVMIQLPNDSEKYSEQGDKIKEKVIKFLDKEIINEHNSEAMVIDPSNYRAIWLSGERDDREKLELITNNKSNIDYLIFKQAAATGWDCPRASILVMFREIGNPIFKTQVLGRIRRMPEGKHYPLSLLNNGYVYTNYSKNSIVSKWTDSNKPKFLKSKRKNEIESFELISEYISRTDYNTLISSEDKWQNIFIDTANKYFKTSRDEKNKSVNLKNFEKKNGKLNTKIDNKIIVDAKIDSPDAETQEWLKTIKETEYELSRTDIERYYDFLCYDTLKKQSDEQAIYNAARSKSPLKKALNVYFKNVLGLNGFYYPQIINELNNQFSKLQKVIKEALINFKPIHDAEVRSKEKISLPKIEIPPEELGFTDEYKIMDVKKNVYDRFYTPKNDKSNGNELEFIDFLENNEKVEWWHKQGDHGKHFFSIIYKEQDEIQNDRFVNALFYPDWIVKTKDKHIWILETKKGATGVKNNLLTQQKMKALKEWFNKNKAYSGGIIEPGRDGWYLIDSIDSNGNIKQRKFNF